MKKILILDNYGSFTYNLAQIVKKNTDRKIDIIENDAILITEVEEYCGIIISPGPGLPCDAGVTLDLIKTYHTSKKILGICLGHQAIAQYFNAQVVNLQNIFHGICSKIDIKQNNYYIFKNIPSKIFAGRYHSWAVSNQYFPEELEIIATDKEGLVMGIKHKIFDIYGLQFHPESIMTKYGEQMVKNWLDEL